MRCSACEADNPPDSRFCDECGAGLVSLCTACGAAVRPGKRFCGTCGVDVGRARSTSAAPSAPPGPIVPLRDAAPLAERRVCSVLFCDLVGFTSLSEARDPEEVRELLSRYFEIARMVIGRYGGVVEKFIGDAGMAGWGTPTATEEDAERAVRAALDLIDAVVPLGRAGTGEDIAASVVYLCSDQGAWVTGQSWNVDGGTVVQH